MLNLRQVFWDNLKSEGGISLDRLLETQKITFKGEFVSYEILEIEVNFNTHNTALFRFTKDNLKEISHLENLLKVLI